MEKNIPGIISVILFCLFPCLQVYFNNAGEAKIIDIMPVVFLYIVVASVLLLLCSFLFKKQKQL